MLLWLLELLGTYGPEAAPAAWAKITMRAALAALASFLLAVVLGPRLIAWLRQRFREPNISPSAEIQRLHQTKDSTPTMGGLFIVAGLLGGLLLFADWSNRFLAPAVLLTLGYAAIGAVDDTLKLRRISRGLSARGKLAPQLIVALVVALMLYNQHAKSPDGLTLWLPLGLSFELGWWFVPLAVVVIVGASNAVNLTDGLDGLAGGCLLFSTAAMTAIVYCAGHAEMAEYLAVPRVVGAGEMAVLAATMIGGVLGFLWFNCHPAQVFMGDTGSLPLGGLLALLALVARQELLLLIVGGVFVIEALSVIVQVTWHRWTRRRVFLCAPLHHHFQFLGWAENKIVVRFWIAAALCALLGVAGMKLNIHEPAHPAAPVIAASEPTRQTEPSQPTVARP
jgi:phospho-N-acetylmuramoyl-pentapeptide-transferase